MYQAGQIIDRKEHIKFANWKNANGGNLISVSLGDGQYRLEEYKEPEKTTEELAQEKRIIRNEYINQITWRLERYNEQKELNIETTDSDEEYISLLQYRQYLRDITKESDFPNTIILSFEEWKAI